MDTKRTRQPILASDARRQAIRRRNDANKDLLERCAANSREFPTAREAVEAIIESPEMMAIFWRPGIGQAPVFAVLPSDDVDELVDAGIQFAFLVDENGKVVTIPVN